MSMSTLKALNRVWSSAAASAGVRYLPTHPTAMTYGTRVAGTPRAKEEIRWSVFDFSPVPLQDPNVSCRPPANLPVIILQAAGPRLYAVGLAGGQEGVAQRWGGPSFWEGSEVVKRWGGPSVWEGR